MKQQEAPNIMKTAVASIPTSGAPSWRQILVFHTLLLLMVANTHAEGPAVVAIKATIAPWLESEDYVGTFVSPQNASLSPQVAGLIDEVFFEVGDVAKQGDIVMQLNADLARLEVERAAALVAEREVALQEAKRLRQEVDQPSVRKLLPQTERLARGSAEQVANAALTFAKAELAIAQQQMEQHSIRAPFTGTVVARPAEVGEWVSPGTGVLRLVRDDKLWLDVRLPQTRSTAIDQVERFDIRVNALGDQPLSATLLTRVPASDADTRTFLVRLLVDELPSGVVPGMSATVVATFGTDESALMVSRDALIRRPDDTITVWTIREEGDQWLAKEKLIRVGRRGRDTVAVVDGLLEDDWVVIRGNETLREGESVTPSFL